MSSTSSPHGEIGETAAEWVIRINDPDATEADFAQWQSWLANDPAHREAYERYERAWGLTGLARHVPWPTQPELSADRYEGAEKVSKWLQRPDWPARSQVAPTGLRKWHLAAAIAAFAIAGAVMCCVRFVGATVLETGTGEQRAMRLGDGSHIDLAGESLLRVRMRPDERSLALDHGEAYFEVAPDPRRPFLVQVGDHTVRAVGTAFNIEKTSDRMVVTVQHGVVEVSTADAEPIRIRAGEQVTADAGGLHRAATTISPQSAASWRNGRLEYLHEELRYVLDDVNRYVDRKVRVSDPQIGGMQFTGTVFIDHLDEWLETLHGSFPVKLVEEDGQRVLIKDRELDPAAR